MVKKMKKRDRFETFVIASKMLSPIFRFMFYVCAFMVVLLAVVALIVLFVNVPTEDMMLPPFMHAEHDDTHEIIGYNIMVGNGIRMYAAYDEVTLADIKTVIYAGIFLAISILLAAAPIFRCLGRLLANVAKRRSLAPENAKYIGVIGFIVLVGNTIILFVSRFYNYYLVKTFVSDGTNMKLSLGVDFGGMVFGLLILFFGLLYAYATKQYAELCPPTREHLGDGDVTDLTTTDED